MPIDNRKSKEQLKETVEEVLNDTPEIVIEEAPEVPVEPEAPENPEPETTESEVPETPEVPEVPAKPDYKEKFQESTKEAMIQRFKNKKIIDTFIEAEAISEPTEEELKSYVATLGQDYEMLDEFSKGLAKRQYVADKRFEKVSEVVKESRQLDAWSDKVETFVNAPETVRDYPLVSENDEEFRKFCMKAERRGMDMTDLAASFLYGLSLKTPVKAPKGAVITPSSGSGADTKPRQLNDEDAFKLRTSNQKEYRRLIKEGKIKIEI